MCDFVHSFLLCIIAYTLYPAKVTIAIAIKIPNNLFIVN